MYPVLLQNLILPIAERALGWPILRHLSEILETQWWDEKRLRELQLGKLSQTLLSARRSVPLFQEILGGVPESRIQDEPLSVYAELPYLVKEDVRENFPHRILSKDFSPSQYKKTSTAGSTGKPLEYVVSNSGYGAWWAHHLRAFHAAGYSLGDRIVYIASVRDLTPTRRIRDFLIRQIQLDAYESSDRLFELYIEKIRKFRPRILRGYPEMLFLLADLVERKGITDIRPASVITNSNKLHEFQREYVEKVFHAPVFDLYSCPESGALAFECEKHQGYHLALEHGLVELADEKGRPAADGTGAIVGTNLDNAAMGIIKYDTGDFGTASGRSCTCGRGLPLLDAVEGRAHSLLVTKDGRYLHGTLFEGPFLHTETFKELGQWVDHIQFVQESEDLLVIKMVRERDMNESGLNDAVEQVKKILGPGMTVEIQFVEKIDKPPSGKRQLVVSKVLPERMKDRLGLK
ncbi:MAG: phenylacetate--CoA ligase family protein [Candidatus Eiseniibacteriota bacterium]|nr:MAG: phenylacetate--CoA ligase family protein [Candidatus Eisenbacteria bacterium]